jgi:hypothetical protein
VIKVTILPGKPHVNEGISKKSGQAYRIVEQAAFCVLPNGEGAAFTVQPPRDAQPYAAGEYTIGPDSFYVRDGQLQFAPKLLPAAAAGGAR